MPQVNQRYGNTDAGNAN